GVSDSGCNQAAAGWGPRPTQTVAALTPRGLHRAARTNDPLALPVGVKGNRVQARRWRDLARHYTALIGAARLKSEPTVARLRSLIWATIEAEQLSDARLRGEAVALHALLHLGAEIRALLRELGLSSAEANSESQPALHDYLRDKNGAAP